MVAKLVTSRLGGKVEQLKGLSFYTFAVTMDHMQDAGCKMQDSVRLSISQRFLETAQAPVGDIP